MAFWAYMLRCADGKYYVGHSDDLEHRVAQHHAGTDGGYTAARRPVELVWSTDFVTRYEALSAERQIKGWSRAKKEGLIGGDWAAVQRLARRHQSFETLQPAAAAPQDERMLEKEESFPSPNRPPIPVRAEEGSKPQAESPSRSTGTSPVERGSSAVENPSRDILTPKPIVVLIRPQLGENIGKAARAMLNFGLTEMRLVEPRDGWPNPASGPAAAGADEVLDKAQVFATTAAAVADCAHVYATTVRRRGVSKPVLMPAAAANEIHAQPGRSAILFGPERSGLETSDVALARAIITVPINPDFSSLNLAQAVILVAYEWSKHAALVQPNAEELLPPAPQDDLEGLIGHFSRLLTPRGYFSPHSRAEVTRLTLRSMLTKPGWNHLEIRTLRGVLSCLERDEDEDKRWDH